MALCKKRQNECKKVQFMVMIWNVLQCRHKEIINELSKKLTNDFGKGFEKANLYRFVQFYKKYPDFFSSAMRQSFLSWTHYIVLLQI